MSLMGSDSVSVEAAVVVAVVTSAVASARSLVFSVVPSPVALVSPASSYPAQPAMNTETTIMATHGARPFIEYPPLLLRAA